MSDNTVVTPSSANHVVQDPANNVVRSENVRLDLDTSRMIFGEKPTPAADGSQLVFTVAHAYVFGSLRVTRASLRMHPTTDFAETSSTTFTMVSAPKSDEPLIVDYTKA